MFAYYHIPQSRHRYSSWSACPVLQWRKNEKKGAWRQILAVVYHSRNTCVCLLWHEYRRLVLESQVERGFIVEKLFPLVLELFSLFLFFRSLLLFFVFFALDLSSSSLTSSSSSFLSSSSSSSSLSSSFLSFSSLCSSSSSPSSTSS